MKNILLGLLVAAGLFSACNKKDDAKNETFKDTLMFGSGLIASNFTLTGQGTSFSVTDDNIYFKLVSKAALDSNSVKFTVLRDGQNIGPYIYKDNPKPTGHLFITGFTFHVIGTYSVSAYLVNNLNNHEQLITTGSFEVK